MRAILVIIFSVFYFSVYAQGGLIDKSIIKQAESHYKKGKEYFLKGDYYKANEEFKKAQGLLAKNKKGKNAKKHYVENKSHSKVKSHSKIENIAKRAKEAVSRGNDNDAIKYYLELLAFMPDNPDVHYNLGVEYLRKRDYFNATQEFMQVLKLNPKDANACYNLGILYEVFLNDKRMANVYYKKYLAMSRDAPDKKMVRGWIDSLESKR